MMCASTYSGPLTGLLVVDFGHYYAGPIAGMMLADQGATVVRVVKPGEKELSPNQYRSVNRNKKLLQLDLKSEEGKAQAIELASKADVLIENFRPGVMQRLGLDYATVKALNPSLVYLSLPGFASTDTDRAHLQAWEGVMAAASGNYVNMSPTRHTLGFPPLYTSVPQCSMYGAMHGVGAIMAALSARERTGLGTLIETPIVDASLTALMLQHFIGLKRKDGGNTKIKGFMFASADDDERQKSFAYSPNDNEDTQLGKLQQAARASAVIEPPMSRPYRCADGRQVYMCSIFESKPFADRLLSALGVRKQVLSEGFVIEGAWELSMTNNVCDPAGLDKTRKERFMEILEAAFLSKASTEWEAILQKAGVTATIVRTRAEWMGIEELQRSGIFISLGEDEKEIIVPGRVTDVSAPDGAEACMLDFQDAEPIDIDDARQLMGGNDKVSIAPNASTLKKGDLLKGLKVLDLSNLFAGPSGCYFLASYGAEVIKADPPYTLFPVLGGFPGKRSILTDVKTAAGRKILERLIKWADVVVHNSLDYVAERLGVSLQQVRDINPEAITCQMSAFGGTLRGYRENWHGVEPTLQHASGLTAHYGTLETPQLHGGVAAADCIGGLSLAYGVLLAVYQKQRTGFAGEVRCSLARATNYYQFPHMVLGTDGSCTETPVGGQFALGEQWWQRLYQCGDQWIYVDASADRAADMATVVLGQTEADEAPLEKAFAEHEAAYWLSRLGDVGIACHAVLGVADISGQTMQDVDLGVADEIALGSTAVDRWADYPSGTPYTTLSPNYVRVGEDKSYLRVNPPPRMGEHTIPILEGLGYDDQQIQELIRLNISHEYMPALGSKKAYYFEPGER